MDNDELQIIQERRQHADSVMRGDGNSKEVSPRVEVSIKQFLLSGAALGVVLIIIVVCLQLLEQALTRTLGNGQKRKR